MDIRDEVITKQKRRLDSQRENISRISQALKARMEALGVSRYSLVKYSYGLLNDITVRSTINGSRNYSIDSLTAMCDMLGLEVVLVEKKDGKKKTD